jgi:hypothetical protein
MTSLEERIVGLATVLDSESERRLTGHGNGWVRSRRRGVRKFVVAATALVVLLVAVVAILVTSDGGGH